MASEDEESRDQLEKVIASLNQVLSHDYVDLGSEKYSIKEEFEVAMGLREPLHESWSMSERSPDAFDHSIDFYESPASHRSNPKDQWSISLTDDFVKDTKGIDRKLQGRILEALLDLVKAPMKLRGNSCKPLVGDLAGLWRLRIGDARLIYKPDTKRLMIYCLAFTSRGDAYR